MVPKLEWTVQLCSPELAAASTDGACGQGEEEAFPHSGLSLQVWEVEAGHMQNSTATV